MKKKLVIFVTGMMLFVQQGQAKQVWYVASGAKGNGTSWSSPSGDLQDRINNSLPGDEVWVMSGVYIPERRADNPLGNHTPGDIYNSFVIHDGVAVYGGFAGWETRVDERDWKNNVTILDGDMGRPYPNALHVVVIADANCAILDGFTVRNGSATLTGVSPQVNGISINTNQGGGIVVEYGNNIQLTNLIVEENEAGTGGGMFLENSTNALLQNIVVRYNIGDTTGGGIYVGIGSNLTLINGLIHQNSSNGRGGGIHLHTNPYDAPTLLINVTIADNNAPAHAIYPISDGIFNDHAQVFFYNCIIWNEIAYNAGLPHNSKISFAFDHCLVMQMHPPGVNGKPTNLDGTSIIPNFVGNFDYHLLPYSACINTGNQHYTSSYTRIDLDGNRRVESTNIDMGAYEFDSSPAPPHIVNGKGLINCRRKYVTPTGSGKLDGSSWQNSSDNLQDMIAQSNPGDEIWVASGVYRPQNNAGNPYDERNSFFLYEGVEVYGGFAGWETWLDERDWKTNTTILDGYLGGQWIGNALPGEPEPPTQPYWQDYYSYHVVTIAGVNEAVLDGFTITNGKAIGWNDTIVNRIVVSDCDGGGIIVCSANDIRLKNLIIENNESRRGGGGMIDNSHETLLQNVIFNGNGNNTMGHKGGAIYISDNSNSTFVNALFHQNLAYEGAALFIEVSKPKLINVTIVDNIGNEAVKIHGNQPIFYNSIIWDQIGSALPAFEHCLVMNMHPPGNNLDGSSLSPDFTSDYHLSFNSPCIDAGNKSYVNPYTQIDLDGNIRISGSNVDMGAYEFNSPQAPHNVINQKSMSDNTNNESLKTIESETIEEKLILSLYPNPTIDDWLTTIYLGRNNTFYYDKSVEIKIYAMDGRLVYNKIFPNGNIQTCFSNLSAGVYKLMLQTQEGKYYTRKLLIMNK